MQIEKEVKGKLDSYLVMIDTDCKSIYLLNKERDYLRSGEVEDSYIEATKFIVGVHEKLNYDRVNEFENWDGIL